MDNPTASSLYYFPVRASACRYDQVSANDSPWLVNHVTPGSPAAVAGLRAGEDYVLGAERNGVRSEDDIAAILGNPRPFKGGIPGPALMYVYNAPTASVRTIVLAANGLTYENPVVAAVAKEAAASKAAAAAKRPASQKITAIVAEAGAEPTAPTPAAGGKPQLAPKKTAGAGSSATDDESSAAPAATGGIAVVAAAAAVAAGTAQRPPKAVSTGSKWGWSGVSLSASAPNSAPPSDTEGDGPSASGVPARGRAPPRAASAAAAAAGTGSGDVTAPIASAAGSRASSASAPLKRLKPEEYVPVKIPPRPPPRKGSVLAECASAAASDAEAGAPGGYDSATGTGAGGGIARKAGAPPTPSREVAVPDAGGSSESGSGVMGALMAGGVAVAYATALAGQSLGKSVRALTDSLQENVMRDITAIGAEITATGALMKEMMTSPDGRWWGAYGLRTKQASRFAMPRDEDVPDEGMWLSPALGLSSGLCAAPAAARIERLGFGDLFKALTDPESIRKAQATEAEAAAAKGHRCLDPPEAFLAAAASVPTGTSASKRLSATAAAVVGVGGDSDDEDAAAAAAAARRERRRSRKASTSGSAESSASAEGRKKGKRRASADSSDDDSDGGGAVGDSGVDGGAAAESDSEHSSEDDAGARGPSAPPTIRRTRVALKRDSEDLARRRAAQMGILSMHAAQGQIAYGDLDADVALTDPAAMIAAAMESQARITEADHDGEGGAGTSGDDARGHTRESTASARGSEPASGAGAAGQGGILGGLLQPRKRAAPLSGSGAAGTGPATNSFSGLGTRAAPGSSTAGGPLAGGASGSSGSPSGGSENVILYSNPMSL